MSKLQPNSSLETRSMGKQGAEALMLTLNPSSVHGAAAPICHWNYVR